MDEIVFGVFEAAWPLVRGELGLDYARVGLLLAVPGVLAALLEPALGLLADVGRRRSIVLVGGVSFAAGLAVIALAPGFAWLLAGCIVLWTASGAFVSLSQASLMDLQPERQEVNMARWTLAGSVGAVLGPLALSAAVGLGSGWRPVVGGLGLVALLLVAGARTVPAAPAVQESLLAAARGALCALRRPSVVRWLVVLEATNLMGDVLLGYLALYFVDVVGLPPLAAGAVVAVWTLAGLAGDALLLLVLARASGLGYLRFSALLALVVYPAFLLAPSAVVKVVLVGALAVLRAGWYAIPQSRVFAELEETSGTAVALSSLSSAASGVLPLIIGMLAERAGLQGALWIALAAPIALLALARREA
jgi:FSR family fosmidomycin resistance protein-like MFS transporter